MRQISSIRRLLDVTSVYIILYVNPHENTLMEIVLPGVYEFIQFGQRSKIYIYVYVVVTFNHFYSPCYKFVTCSAVL